MLPFKDGRAFVEYQCQFGFTEIIPKQGITALVLDGKVEFGLPAPVILLADGNQCATLLVASKDGGFLVVAETNSPRGDQLIPGDVVIWVPLKKAQASTTGELDERTYWEGYIVAKVAPEISLLNSEFNLISKY